MYSMMNARIKIIIEVIVTDLVSAALKRKIRVITACRARKMLVVHKYCFHVSPDSIRNNPTGSIIIRTATSILIVLLNISFRFRF
jgi:hypothetical protein